MIKSAIRDIAAKCTHLFPKGCVYFGHGVADEIKDPYVENLHMPKSDFITLLEFWKKAGVKFYSLQDVSDLSRKGFKSKKPWIHFTFDDGYQNNLSSLMPIMENYEIPFTVFATTGLICDRERMPSYKIKVAILKGHGELVLGNEKLKLNSSTNRKERMILANRLIKYYKTLPWDELRIFMAGIEAVLENGRWNEMNRHFYNDQLLSVNELKKLAQSDLVNVGVHGHQHIILHEKQCKKQVAREINEPIIWLKDELALETLAFAYPNGQENDYSSYSIDCTKKNGLEFAFTTHQDLIRPYADSHLLPRMFLESSVDPILSQWLILKNALNKLMF